MDEYPRTFARRGGRCNRRSLTSCSETLLTAVLPRAGQRSLVKRRCKSALPSLRATPSNSHALARSWTVSVFTFAVFTCSASTLAATYACALAVFLCSLGLICSSMSARAWLRALRMSVRDLRGQEPQAYCGACLDLGGIQFRTDAGGDAATEQTHLIQRRFLGDFRQRDCW